MADPLSKTLEPSIAFFEKYIAAGVTLHPLSVMTIAALLRDFRAAALDLERDVVELRAEVSELTFVDRAPTGGSTRLAASASGLAHRLREFGSILTKAQSKQLTAAAVRSVQECVESLASMADALAHDISLQPARAQNDVDTAAIVDAVAEGLRSGKVTRLHRPLRPRAAFSDGREGDAS